MVLDEIWEKHGADDKDLCIGCLESRLGRVLDKSDFYDYPINTVGWGKQSARLLDRLS